MLRCVHTSAVFLGIALASIVLAQEAKIPGYATEPERDKDPISELNGVCREIYANAHSHILLEQTPIVYVTGNQLILIRDGHRIEGTIVHHNYHDLKTFAHVPMAVYLCMSPYGEGALSEEQIESLMKLQSMLNRVQSAISEQIEDVDLAKRQQIMLQSCSQFIHQSIANRAFTEQGLQQLIKNCLPQIRENVRLAVRIRIDNYHNQMMAWKEILTDTEWSQLNVVISGATMPRKNSLAVQYFARLLRTPGEGKRIIYAESIFDEQGALKLLGTHLLDSEIGRDFFGNPWRMHRDLLGVEAALYLDELEFAE